MRLMEGEHVGPFNLGNPGEFTMLELAQVFSSFLSRYVQANIIVSLYFNPLYSLHNRNTLVLSCLTCIHSFPCPKNVHTSHYSNQ